MTKIRIFGISAALLVLLLTSCNEESETAMVWGTLSYYDSFGSHFEASGGTLETGGGDYYGSCQYSQDKFHFIVGSRNVSKMNSASDYYFEIRGIEGPPSTGPYVSAETPRSDEDRGFSNGRIATGGKDWVFDTGLINRERCKATLFVEAKEGDLTPLKYQKKRFEYLVKINCINGIKDAQNQTGPVQPLNGFELELWFDQCN